VAGGWGLQPAAGGEEGEPPPGGKEEPPGAAAWKPVAAAGLGAEVADS
jgi:hypothetical protein